MQGTSRQTGDCEFPCATDDMKHKIAYKSLCEFKKHYKLLSQDIPTFKINSSNSSFMNLEFTPIVAKTLFIKCVPHHISDFDDIMSDVIHGWVLSNPNWGIPNIFLEYVDSFLIYNELHPNKSYRHNLVPDFIRNPEHNLKWDYDNTSLVPKVCNKANLPHDINPYCICISHNLDSEALPDLAESILKLERHRIFELMNDLLNKYLAFAFKHGVYHKDLHAHNVMFDKRRNSLVIIDYGRMYISDLAAINGFGKDFITAQMMKLGRKNVGEKDYKQYFANTRGHEEDFPVKNATLNGYPVYILDMISYVLSTYNRLFLQKSMVDENENNKIRALLTKILYFKNDQEGDKLISYFKFRSTQYNYTTIDEFQGYLSEVESIAGNNIHFLIFLRYLILSYIYFKNFLKYLAENGYLYGDGFPTNNIIDVAIFLRYNCPFHIYFQFMDDLKIFEDFIEKVPAISFLHTFHPVHVQRGGGVGVGVGTLGEDPINIPTDLNKLVENMQKMPEKPPLKINKSEANPYLSKQSGGKLVSMAKVLKKYAKD